MTSNALIALVLALLASIGINVYQYVSKGRIAADLLVCQSAKDFALDANIAKHAATEALQAALNECTGQLHLADQTRANQALQHAKDVAAIAKRHDELKARLATRMDGECRAWAQSPSCGVTK